MFGYVIFKAGTGLVSESYPVANAEQSLLILSEK
jgi:hypothetical protein